jgi:acyl carrier protein
MRTGGIVMGLDSVELVMDVERTFGITIPDADAEKITTVGALHRYVVARLGLEEAATTRSRCPSQVAFYRLRRSLVDGLGIDRGGVRPASPMGPFIAAGDGKATWARLEQVLGVPLPALVRPKALVESLTLAVIAAAAATALWTICLGVPLSLCLLLALAVAFLLGILAGHVSAPFATRVPPACAMVRDAVGVVLLGDVGSIRDELDSGAVWSLLRSLLITQLGVRPEELTDDAEFVRDLGLD